MDALNGIMTRIADALIGPVAHWPPALLLVLVSSIGGVAMAWVYGLTSSQGRLRVLADRTRAQLAGMRLFGEDALVVLRCQGELLRLTGLRLLHALPPVAVLAVPVLLLLSQLALRYEHRPLEAGNSAVVELCARQGSWEAARAAGLETPPGVVVDTPALRDPVARTVSWRIRMQEAGSGELRFCVGEATISKRLAGAAGPADLIAVSARRPGRGLWERLLNPGEPALPADGPARAIVIRYPRRSTPVLWLDWPWWVTFLVTSILAALLSGRFLRVRF